MEIGHGVIQIRLADPSIGGGDVHEKGAEIDGVESFSGVIKNGIVDIVDRHRELVARDVEYHLVCVPCLACGGVGGTQFLVSCCGTGWGNWVDWSGMLKASPLQAR
jgi:hypothetical protein